MKKKKYQAFTLIEMMVVLFIISVLILLFVPNLSKQKNKVDAEGKSALQSVLTSQVTLYQMNETGDVTLDNLVSKGYITEKQKEQAEGWGIEVP
ncbi:competence type IV pilus major pilin ComGC [Vagococcus xieshaowenii]|uniref:Prepilin-type N-terminal cleavage/methylation domain-containing protein n=1 Tax=Vagococcus xieshaowenii TaxID=2562451 RepID=A0AAJ5JM13_9ENTE|nr:competence type IV pilus major pilin ComGC [Vagococcus xieshaowenii]QCA28094.1 prepilin-type N-terminal cleavage/methylation domain-containing protein [Vagococcus xieshaowenii]TFZ40137.1 prepilin-type N-terminal cleavage/methylation domain-containing protein [Vagococcus xieshaowenii]